MPRQGHHGPRGGRPAGEDHAVLHEGRVRPGLDAGRRCVHSHEPDGGAAAGVHRGHRRRGARLHADLRGFRCDANAGAGDGVCPRRAQGGEQRGERPAADARARGQPDGRAGPGRRRDPWAGAVSALRQAAHRGSVRAARAAGARAGALHRARRHQAGGRAHPPPARPGLPRQLVRDACARARDGMPGRDAARPRRPGAERGPGQPAVPLRSRGRRVLPGGQRDRRRDP